jgi:hypothetical protein
MQAVWQSRSAEQPPYFGLSAVRWWRHSRHHDDNERAHAPHGCDGVAFTLTLPGFLIGLVLWTLCAAVAGWLIGLIYNVTGGSKPAT